MDKDRNVWYVYSVILFFCNRFQAKIITFSVRSYCNSIYMSRPQVYILVIFILFPVTAASQDTGFSHELNYKISSNPAITGIEGDGILNLDYLNLYPGDALNLHSAFLSYDAYFPFLHGGAGIYLSDDYLGGIVNDIKGGFSYAYHFQAGRDIWLSSGLSASFYHRGLSFGNAVLPDQIDPLRGAVLPSGDMLTYEGRTILDLSTGFMIITGNFYCGFSLNHLAKPDISDSDFTDSRLNRLLTIQLAGDFIINREKEIKISPVIMAGIEKEFYSGSAGVVLNANYLSINALLYTDNTGNIDAQSGFSVMAGLFTIFYNYRINLFWRENLLPFSLHHHTGVAFRLNNVDKRKTVKTINFPKL